MSRSDIRVRLTAEGVKEVIDAIRQVRAAGQDAERASKAIGAAGDLLRTSLGAIGISASVAGVVAFGKAAFNSAQEASNLAKSLGITVEEFTRLAYVANQSDIDQQSLAQGLLKYQKTLSEAVTQPNGEAAQSFKQLGLSVSDLKDKSLTDQLKLIADRIASLAAPQDRARASADLFGRSLGPQFVRVLADGAAGISQLTAESDRLGATLSTNTAAQIDRTDASIKRLKATINSFGRKGLAEISDEFFIGTSAGGPAEQIEEFEKAIADLQNATGLKKFLSGGQEAVDAAIAGWRRRINDLQTELLRKQNAEARRQGQPSGLINVETDATRKAAADTAQAAVDAQLKIVQEGFKQQDDATKDYYNRGLASLDTYYAARREIVQASADADIRAAQAKLAIVEATPADDDAAKAAKAKQIEQLRAEIALRRVQAQRELAQLGGEEINEQKKKADAEKDLYANIATLEGDRHAQFERNLDKEVEELTKLLTQSGATADEITAASDRLRKARTASFNLDEVSRSSNLALASFNQDADQIRRDQEAGLVSQQQGEQRLIELERQRLVVLQAQADALLTAAEATGDDEKISQARAYAASVNEIAVSLRAATDATTRLNVALQDGLQQGLASTINGALLGKIRSLGDAFRNLSNVVQQALAQVISDLLSKRLSSAIDGLLSSLGSIRFGSSSSLLGAGYGGGGTVMAARGGELRKLAGGGPVDATPGGQLVGPGTPTSDSMLLWGSDQEFMVRAAAAQQPGGIAFLNALNEGRITIPQIQQAMAGLRTIRGMELSIPRFASGGALSEIATAGQAGGFVQPTVNVQVNLTLKPTPGMDTAAVKAVMAQSIPAIVNAARAAVADDALRGRGTWKQF